MLTANATARAGAAIIGSDSVGDARMAYERDGSSDGAVALDSEVVITVLVVVPRGGDCFFE